MFSFLRRLLTPTPPLVRKRLLTANEAEFFSRLLRALPSYHIFAQVSMGALMDVPPTLSPRRRYELRQKFVMKIVDFVVCRPDLSVVCLVELDDRTHEPAKDAARDAMLRQVGYVTLRWQSRAPLRPQPAEIAEMVARINAMER